MQVQLNIFQELITIITAVALSTTGLILAKDLFMRKMIKVEQNEVQEEVERVLQQFDEADSRDGLKLMRRNLAELKEYYVINKQQARNTFTSALVVSFLGFLIFVAGVVVSFTSNANGSTMVYSTISGAVVEIISGLFFWLYRQSLRQINLFYESLRNTEKVLTVVQLAERVSDAKRDDIYSFIIQSILKNSVTADSDNCSEELEEEFG